METIHKVVLCGNHETLADGVYEGGDSEFSCAVVDAGVWALEAALFKSGHAGDAEHKVDSQFASWHGGWPYKILCGNKAGTSGGTFVVCMTAEADCPAWLQGAMEEASLAMAREADKWGRREDDQRAKELEEEVHADD